MRYTVDEFGEANIYILFDTKFNAIFEMFSDKDQAFLWRDTLNMWEQWGPDPRLAANA